MNLFVRLTLWLFMTAMLVGFYAIFGYALLEPSGWVATPCQVDSSQVDLESESLKWTASYSYRWEERQYHRSEESRLDAEDLQDRFPRGTGVCRVNPRNPEESCLHPPSLASRTTAAYFLVCLLLFAVGFWRVFVRELPGSMEVFAKIAAALFLLGAILLVRSWNLWDSSERQEVSAKVLGRSGFSTQSGWSYREYVWLEYWAGGRLRKAQLSYDSVFASTLLKIDERLDQGSVRSAWVPLHDLNRASLTPTGREDRDSLASGFAPLGLMLVYFILVVAGTPTPMPSRSRDMV